MKIGIFAGTTVFEALDVHRTLDIYISLESLEDFQGGQTLSNDFNHSGRSELDFKSGDTAWAILNFSEILLTPNPETTSILDDKSKIDDGVYF